MKDRDAYFSKDPCADSWRDFILSFSVACLRNFQHHFPLFWLYIPTFIEDS